jgi:hypothetical protein
MIRRSAASFCIFTMFFNIAFLCAQDNGSSDIEKAADMESVDELSPAVEEQSDADSLKTAIVDEESLFVETQTVVEKDSLPATLEEELPQKQFKGTAKDVILAVTSILGWLFFMWLAANQRE